MGKISICHRKEEYVVITKPDGKKEVPCCAHCGVILNFNTLFHLIKERELGFLFCSETCLELELGERDELVESLKERKCEVEGCYNYRVKGYLVCEAHLYGKPIRMQEEEIALLKARGI